MTHTGLALPVEMTSIEVICNFSQENMPLMGDDLPGINREDLSCKRVSLTRMNICTLSSQSALGGLKSSGDSAWGWGSNGLERGIV